VSEPDVSASRLAPSVALAAVALAVAASAGADPHPARQAQSIERSAALAQEQY